MCAVGRLFIISYGKGVEKLGVGGLGGSGVGGGGTTGATEGWIVVGRIVTDGSDDWEPWLSSPDWVVVGRIVTDGSDDWELWLLSSKVIST